MSSLARLLVGSLVAMAAAAAAPATAHAETPRATPEAGAKAPGKASTKPAAKSKPARTARVQKPEPRTCVKPAVAIESGSDTTTFALARCDGTPAPLAVEQLSILARPGSAAKPKQPLETLARSKGNDVAPGIRRVDPRLVERLELAVDHFRKPGDPAKIQLISGVRPRSAGSYHQSGKALDFRIDGVTNEALVAFCKTLPDTGCGYYPNSLFVHMDVREHGAGHVSWIDVSKPGETPKYVSSWPLPKGEAVAPAAPVTPAAPVAPAAPVGPEAPRTLDDTEHALALPALPVPEPREAGGKPKIGKKFFF